MQYAVRSAQIMANVSKNKQNIMRQCMKVHLPPLASSWDAQSLVQGRLEGFTYKWWFSHFQLYCTLIFFINIR